MPDKLWKSFSRNDVVMPKGSLMAASLIAANETERGQQLAEMAATTLHSNEEAEEGAELPVFDLASLLTTAPTEQPLHEEEDQANTLHRPTAAVAEPAPKKRKAVACKYCHQEGHRADNKMFPACNARLQADKAKERADQADKAPVEEDGTNQA
jgi:hypothetical protein